VPARNLAHGVVVPGGCRDLEPRAGDGGA
jgi:hypothetical protein